MPTTPIVIRSSQCHHSITLPLWVFTSVIGTANWWVGPHYSSLTTFKGYSSHCYWPWEVFIMSLWEKGHYYWKKRKWNAHWGVRCLLLSPLTVAFFTFRSGISLLCLCTDVLYANALFTSDSWPYIRDYSINCGYREREPAVGYFTVLFNPFEICFYIWYFIPK